MTTNTHQLDLLDNALDSLAEALAKFEEGDAGELKAYKFAVLHMAHFIELVFKHHIAEKHPLLIYKEPFGQKLDRNKTISPFGMLRTSLTTRRPTLFQRSSVPTWSG